MTRDRDPFELLPNFADPEPDPVVMQATIAQSREAFANRRPASQGESSSFNRWLRQSAGWLMPAGLGVAALCVALVVAPGLMQTNSGSGTRNDAVADLPTAMPPSSTTLSRGDAVPADAAPSSTGTRMGMQPAPGQGQGQGQAPVAPTESVFQGDGVRIGLRSSPSMLEFSFPDLSGDMVMDRLSLFPGETASLIGALRLPERDLVALQLQGTSSQFWWVYRMVDGAYQRDTELSELVSDAADKAELISRLPAN